MGALALPLQTLAATLSTGVNRFGFRHDSPLRKIRKKISGRARKANHCNAKP
jgi:hypothetical protein